MNLAPIVLFTYNRPWHTKQVLDALAINKEARESIIYIYCDGAKENSSQENISKIQQLRLLVNKENRFKEVIVKEQEQNKGLANSIIDGVTEVINKFGRVIVLEDDLVPSIGFLHYMNTALQLYETESRVSAIHGWSRKLDMNITQEKTFFIKGADCWGWATWLRNWKLFNYDAKNLYTKIIEKDLSNYFNLYGSINYVGMLKDQIEGRIDSWAIRWQASMFLENKLCLHPVNSLIKNIGTDGSGINSGMVKLEENIVDEVVIRKMDIEENIGYYFALYKKMQNNSVINANSRVTLKELLRCTKSFLLSK